MGLPVTHDEYRACGLRLGLSQIKLGALLGHDERTSRRYALGERTVPPSVSLALALAVYLKETHGWEPMRLRTLLLAVEKPIRPA